MRGTLAIGLLLLTASPVAGQVKDPPPSRPRLVLQLGHAAEVRSVSLSENGARLLTGSDDGTAILWETDTGREIHRFVCGKEVVGTGLAPERALTADAGGTVRTWDPVTGRLLLRVETGLPRLRSAVLSPNGLSAACAGDGAVVLYDAATGRERWRGIAEGASLTSVAFTPDGKTLVALLPGHPGQIVWMEVESGRVLRRHYRKMGEDASLAVSPDGRLVAIARGPPYRDALVLDAATGRELRRVAVERGVVLSVAFTPDGRLLTGDTKWDACLWDLETGELLRSFEAPIGEVVAFAVARDGQRFVVGTDLRLAVLWNLESGKGVRAFLGRQNSVRALDVSPDGLRLLAARGAPGTSLWSLAEGREARRLPQTTEPGNEHSVVHDAAFSPDGRLAVMTDGHERTEVYDVETGDLRWRVPERNRHGRSRFSSDGRLLVAGTSVWDMETRKRWPAEVPVILAVAPGGRRALGSLRVHQAGYHAGVLHDLETGRELVRTKEHGTKIYAGAFSPDGSLVATAGGSGVRVSDAVTGESRRWLSHDDEVHAVRFSPDGARILTGSFDRTARVFDVETGREVLRLSGHVGPVTAVGHTPDGRWLLTGSADGSVIFWAAETGKEAARLVGFFDGSFAVVDPEGRYDASRGGDVEGLHWVLGGEPVSLDQLKERYYDPGLLAKILGHEDEPLREVGSLAAPKLHPRVDLQLAEGSPGVVRVRLENRGGGIGRVVVKVNGKEVRADARAPDHDPEAPKAVLELELADDPRLRPGEANTVEVVAYNAEGYLRSRGLRISYTPPARPEPRPPELFAVVAGVADYSGSALDLRFAARDAEAFAGALGRAAERLFGAERVHLSLLTTGSPGPGGRPTRANLVAALSRAAEARSTDLLVLYLAGHGVDHGGDFHFLTAEAASADLTDPEVRARVALSSRELTEIVKAIPALKQVLILDTCAAGGLIEELTAKRGVPSSQVRSLERVKDRTGLYVLAGCAADRVSYEATRYAQGLLTYSLLFGMRGGALREEEYVDVSSLFGFAVERVPELARGIGGIQRPILAVPRGGASFDIGRLTRDDREKIPLRSVRPLVLRSNFQEESELFDVLDLGTRIDRELRAVSSGPDAPIVFVDARRYPGACLVSGRYRLEDGEVHVEVRVRRPNAEAAAFHVTGAREAPEALAESVVRAVLDELE